MGKTLLIVESPTKAKTLSKYLKEGYIVKASKGHVKDLPENKLGVSLEDGFKAEYVILPGKRKILEELKKWAALADDVLLGPDPDREGEAIAWHIKEELFKNGGSNKPVGRVLFFELTQRGIERAVKEPGPLNSFLYEAQRARRILDRLVGYLISPVLWQKVRKGLSAGRVQSVALRLICEREQEIYKFTPEEYWTIEGSFIKRNQPNQEYEKGFKGKLIVCYGNKNFSLKAQEEVKEVIDRVKERHYLVKDISVKKHKLKPFPPFITSTLQQEASRRLRFSPKKTMQIAQQLYEGVELPDLGAMGLITYMRTDSPRISEEAVEAVRILIKDLWGKEYLPFKAYEYKAKSSSQDAHEAIRPTDVFKTPESLKPFLNKDQYALYDLIWKRFVACQMKQAEVIRTTVDIASQDSDDFVFRVSGSKFSFPGFIALYSETSDEHGEEENEKLPSLIKGEMVDLADIEGLQHFTKPPHRYSEASLIKELEENGIGRPSTYATIISTIQERGYVTSDKRILRPTEIGFIVNDLLVKHFPEILDISFTAHMETKLDEVSRGEFSLLELLKNFYGRFKPVLDRASKEITNLRLRGIPAGSECPECGKELYIRWFNKGDPFVECSNCTFKSSYQRDENGHIHLLPQEELKEICDKCGSPLVLKRGPYGSFLACSGYPACKNTKPLTLGIPCPKQGCSGEIVERRSKKGRVFYGCSNFPECQEIFNRKPFAKTCPQCGYPIMGIAKKKGAGLCWTCFNKSCGYVEPYSEKDE